LFYWLFDVVVYVSAGFFLRRVCGAVSEAFLIFAGIFCCWKLQLTLFVDFSKNPAKSPFKRTDSKLQHQKKMLQLLLQLTPHNDVATITPVKQPLKNS
jgi:hypothetical protein